MGQAMSVEKPRVDSSVQNTGKDSHIIFYPTNSRDTIHTSGVMQCIERVRKLRLAEIQSSDCFFEGSTFIVILHASFLPVLIAFFEQIATEATALRP
jgi:hypothetical protein